MDRGISQLCNIVRVCFLDYEDFHSGLCTVDEKNNPLPASLYNLEIMSQKEKRMVREEESSRSRSNSSC